MKLQMMFAATFSRGHVSMLGEGGVGSEPLTSGEMIAKAPWD